MVYLLFFSLFIQGCISLIGAGASWVYKEGNLETRYAAPYEQTWNAALAATRDLGFEIVSTANDATKGVIEAKQPDGTNVKITMEPANPEITFIKIRVGILGDEEKSKVIEGRIHALLGKSGS